MPLAYHAGAIQTKRGDGNDARSKSSAALDAWFGHAAGSLLGAFANGIAEDRHAVAAAITEPWPDGQTEGQITKQKLVKCQMYGHASLNLLRARLCAT